jgi:hypothetical protein
LTDAALVAEIAEAYGSSGRWHASAELVIQVSAGGLAVSAKLQRSGLRNLEAQLATDQQRVAFTPYPRRGQRGVFEHGAVRIEAADRSVVRERADPQAELRSLRRRLWWDDLDVLYFGASSLWTYMAAPFILGQTGFDAEALEPWLERGEVWRRLSVTFPPEIHTHSRHQVFYIGEDGLIRRHDYTAREFGDWAKSAHYWFDHHQFDGLIVPRRRRVLPRRADGRARSHPLFVWINVDDVSPLHH